MASVPNLWLTHELNSYLKIFFMLRRKWNILSVSNKLFQKQVIHWSETEIKYSSPRFQQETFNLFRAGLLHTCQSHCLHSALPGHKCHLGDNTGPFQAQQLLFSSTGGNSSVICQRRTFSQMLESRTAPSTPEILIPREVWVILLLGRCVILLPGRYQLSCSQGCVLSHRYAPCNIRGVSRGLHQRRIPWSVYCFLGLKLSVKVCYVVFYMKTKSSFLQLKPVITPLVPHAPGELVLSLLCSPCGTWRLHWFL